MPELLRFEGKDALLAGELVMPPRAAPHPAVVLLHGTGGGTRPYLRAHADAFAAAGVASLIFDRRGEGESTGAHDMSVDTLAADAVAAVRAVRGHREVDAGRTGLWGYSNGAWVAARTAEVLGDAAFLVLTGASAVSQGDAEVYRRTRELREAGIAEPTLAAVERSWQIILGTLGGAEWQDEWTGDLARSRTVIEADEALAALPITDLARSNPNFHPVPPFASPLVANLRENRGSVPELGYDPVPSLAKLACPVLVVLAEDDANVPMSLSLPKFEGLAAARRDGSFRVEVLPGADHLFSSEAYRPFADQATLHPPLRAEDYRPGYLELMAHWMADAVRVTPIL